uniref:Uncharacterized protein n=1 Tax=Anopheles christyi TaxID=43041 RepID=A0A182K1G1_9DIPT
MRNDESFTEDESADDCSVREMHSGFKALYEELDRLSKQATDTVRSVENESVNEAEVLRKEDISDLISYARKFIRETRKSFVTVDEHGIQCEPERRSDKKVSTPKAWKQAIVVGKVPQRENTTGCVQRRRSAVTVIQAIPRDVPCVLTDEPAQERAQMTPGSISIQTEPLNNTVAVETLPEKNIKMSLRTPKMYRKM